MPVIKRYRMDHILGQVRGAAEHTAHSYQATYIISYIFWE